jgi:hypothetical protein
MIRAIKIKNGVYNKAEIRVAGLEIGTTTPIYAVIHKKSEFIDYGKFTGYLVSRNKPFPALPSYFVDITAGIGAEMLAKIVRHANQQHAERSPQAAKALSQRRKHTSKKAARYLLHTFKPSDSKSTRPRAFRTALSYNAAELGRELVSTPPAERKRKATKAAPRRHADIC